MVRSAEYCDAVAGKILASGDAAVMDDDMACAVVGRDNDTDQCIGEMRW